MKKLIMNLNISNILLFKCIVSKDKKSKYDIKVNEAVSIFNCSYMYLNYLYSGMYKNFADSYSNSIKELLHNYIDNNYFECDNLDDINKLCDYVAEGVNYLLDEKFAFNDELYITYDNKFHKYKRQYYYGKLEYVKKKLIRNK